MFSSHQSACDMAFFFFVFQISLITPQLRGWNLSPQDKSNAARRPRTGAEVCEAGGKYTLQTKQFQGDHIPAGQFPRTESIHDEHFVLGQLETSSEPISRRAQKTLQLLRLVTRQTPVPAFLLSLVPYQSN